MSKPLVDIMNLNLTRYGKNFDLEKFKKTFYEEVEEMFRGIENNDTYETIDGANDAIVVLAGLITQHGYNPELTLKQVVKEIKSRNQSKEQYDRWKDNPKLQDVEKWEKDKTQDTNTLYKADFSTCKISK